jgi:hypothetical protein
MVLLSSEQRVDAAEHFRPRLREGRRSRRHRQTRHQHVVYIPAHATVHIDSSPDANMLTRHDAISTNAFHENQHATPPSPPRF